MTLLTPQHGAGNIQQMKLSDLLNFTPKQMEARKALYTHKYNFFGGAMGGGKASACSATVLTTSGYKPMGEVVVGEELWHPAGSRQRVIAVHPQGVQPLYRVTFADGSALRCTGDHLWTVCFVNGNCWQTWDTNTLRLMMATGGQYRIPVSPTFNEGITKDVRRIVSIEPDGEEEAQCITVDHPSGLYMQTCDNIITHNSYFIRWANIDRLIQWYTKYGLTNVHTMVAAETYPALNVRQLTKVEIEFPPWLGRFYKDAKEFRLKPEYGSGVIEFRNLEDTDSYSSAEYAMISVDELTLSPLKVFLDLKQRLRWPGVEDPCFLGTGNPVGVGLGWVKKLWIDRIFDDNVNENPSNFSFVQSFAQDNPYLAQDYLDMLETLPEDRKQALLYGSWNQFAGQFFTTFSTAVHKCDPPQLPTQVIRWRSIDWGTDAPAAVYWYAYYQGKLYVYRELYVKGQTAASLAKMIVSNTPSDEQIAVTVVDPSVFAHSGHERSIGEVLSASGVPCTPGNNRRKDGWDRVREWLKPYDETLPDGTLKRTARLQISSACPNMLRTFPMAVYDKVKTEDLDTKGEEHACLVAGTLVATKRGDIPIESVTTGDQVMTRQGWRSVIAAGMTATHAQTRTITLSDGRSITGTGNHPIYLSKKGFVPLDTVRYNDIIDTWQPIALYSTESPSGATQMRRVIRHAPTILQADRTGSKVSVDSTKRYGARALERFRVGMSSIISTATRSIMTSQICSVFPSESMSCFTEDYLQKSSRQQSILNISPAYAHWPHGGTQALKGTRGIAKTRKTCKQRSFQKSVFASSVARYSSRKSLEKLSAFVLTLAKHAGESALGWITKIAPARSVAGSLPATSIQRSATVESCVPDTVASIVEIRDNEQKQPVYNLTVDGCHEYFANGILVHNCDSLRYLCMFLPMPDQMQEMTVITDKEEAFQIQEGIVYRPQAEDVYEAERSAGY